MKSTLTDYADVLLLTVPVKYRYQKIDIPSRTSIHALLDAIYLNAVTKNSEKVAGFLSKSEEELSKNLK